MDDPEREELLHDGARAAASEQCVKSARDIAGEIAAFHAELIDEPDMGRKLADELTKLYCESRLWPWQPPEDD